MAADLQELRAALSNAVRAAGGTIDFPGFPLWDPGPSALKGPRVVRSSALNMPVAEPDDAKRGAVSALATVQNGGTEFKFNKDGIIVPQPGAIGTYFARALSSNVKGAVNRWASAAPGRLIGYDAQGSSLFLGTDVVGSITPSGVYNLEFYAKPENVSWPDFRDHIRAWTVANGSDMGTAAAAPVAPAGSTAFVANAVVAASSDGEMIPNSADGVVTRVIYDPTDDSGTVVWVGSQDQVVNFTGLPLIEGGLYDLPGELWVSVQVGSVNVYSGQFT